MSIKYQGGGIILTDGKIVHMYATVYTVTFKDWDNTTLRTEMVDPGGNATPPADPTRADYLFNGWSGVYTNVTSNRTITATYIIDPPLYAFTSHEFTTGGQAGKTGPSLATLVAAYNTVWGANTAYFNMITNGIQIWTVPKNGDYQIEAYGAEGGHAYLTSNSTINLGGKGAYIKGTFTFVKGQKIQLLVGQQGGDHPNSFRGGGGGGGSFVVNESDNTLLIAAGGGGGAGQYAPNDDNNGRIGTAGGAGTVGTFGAGGINGNGGGATAYVGGGAGWLSNGIDSGYGKGGARFLEGGIGGALYSDGGGASYTDGKDGGFGGGGGAYLGGGGGGGYSGGGAGGWSYSGQGGGGGSYNSGSNQSASVAAITGHGKIIITQL